MRGERGRFQATQTPLDRFLALCEFEPETGCVVWKGWRDAKGYGRFWFEGRMVLAHRWAAVYIHGIDLGDDTAHHNCPHTWDGNPNTSCVRHVEALTLSDNVKEGNERRRLRVCKQSKDQLQFWAFVDKGLEPNPRRISTMILEGQLFYPPNWLDNSPRLPYSEFNDNEAPTFRQSESKAL